jgi:hypothetical protein
LLITTFHVNPNVARTLKGIAQALLFPLSLPPSAPLNPPPEIVSPFIVFISAETVGGIVKVRGSDGFGAKPFQTEYYP